TPLRSKARQEGAAPIGHFQVGVQTHEGAAENVIAVLDFVKLRFNASNRSTAIQTDAPTRASTVRRGPNIPLAAKGDIHISEVQVAQGYRHHVRGRAGVKLVQRN